MEASKKAMSAGFTLSKMTIPSQQWYVDTELLGKQELGDYYLALRNVDGTPKFVFQREQDGDNVFSVQYFKPVNPQSEIVFAQVQAENFNLDSQIERRAVATMHASSATTLEATTWPDDWTRKNAKTPFPVDSRLFNLVTKLNGNSTIESVLYKGYFLAVDTDVLMEINKTNFFAPALLSTTPDKFNPTNPNTSIVPVEFKNVGEWYPNCNSDQ